MQVRPGPTTQPADAESRQMPFSTDPAPSTQTMDWITRLIGIDTTSRESNKPLIDAVAEQFRAVGVEPVLLPNAEGTKVNLWATFPAADGTTTGGIVLSGHTDVVPVDGQPWDSDPFAPVIRDGRLYGRGSADMKSFIGAVVARVPALAAASLTEPVHVALSYDEDVGCTGVVPMVQDVVRREIKPRACVVGEPTSMRVVVGHKAMTLIMVTFHGVAAHSSLTPQGVNSIEHAAALVRFVRSVADEFRTQGPFDEAYVVPFTTATVNQIAGGIAVNTVPAECSLSFEFRSVAAVDVAATIERFTAEVRRIEALMRQENPAAYVEITVAASAPALETAGDCAAVELATRWGGSACADKVTYGTEGGLFQGAGIPTVVCGPGDIAQAHSPNEFIELAQIARCEEFLDRMLEDLSA